MAKKNVTINDLAVMVKHGFDEMDKRFTGRLDGIGGRLDGIDQRLVNIESDVSYLKSRVGEIARTLDRHEEILEEHSEELKWIHKKIDELTDPRNENRVTTYKEFSALQMRVAALEQKIAAKIR